MTQTPTSWPLLDGVRTAWLEAPSLTDGAALAGRLLAEVPGAAVDVRAGGVRVRVESAEQAEAASAVADGLGPVADPSALQQVGVVLESPDPAAVGGFWREVLAYDAAGAALTDPLRRDPTLRLEQSADRRPLRNRLHLDVVRPGAVVERVEAGEAGGPYGVRHADADGNEVDLVPGDPLGETDATGDWQSVFGAVACYRTTSTEHQRELATGAATLADEAGFPLRIDLRPGLVVLDTGKDRWHPDAHGLDLDFATLAGRLQSAARETGATAEASLPRFVQLFLDAADVAALRTFWAAALGYEPDRRDGVTDLVDPRGLSPVIAFQPLDADDADRRAQRDRMHVELAVPEHRAQERVEAMLAAGGRLTAEADGRRTVLDPEGNELVVVGG